MEQQHNRDRETVSVHLTLRERDIIARVLEHTMQWSGLPLYEHEYRALASFIEKTNHCAGLTGGKAWV